MQAARLYTKEYRGCRTQLDLSSATSEIANTVDSAGHSSDNNFASQCPMLALHIHHISH
jgi:hypothetical protein